jgi:hypothetical protein
MHRFIRRTALGAVLLLGVLAALTALTRSEAIAQIRAALTKNVDEPGRTPWETRSQILPGNGCYQVSDCFNYSEIGRAYTFDLRPVPVGKRWIVQTASGGLTNGGGNKIQIELSGPKTAIVFDGDKWIFGGPYFAGTAFDSLIFSANLHTSFGPGETPKVRVSSDPSGLGYSVIVFNGYLIDATN